MLVTNQLLVVIDYFSRGKKILWEPMATSNFMVTNILPNIFFHVQQKEETHAGLEQLVSLSQIVFD